jgi:hypothetical protein
MRARAGVTAIAAVAVLTLISGCGPKGAPELMHLRATDGPDEFAILPPKPLAMPETLADLPPPTPGGANRTDPTPEADAIAALGGKPQATQGGVPAADAALYATASRFGVASGIRSTLASEDLDWRRDNNGRILERLFNVNVYYKAYADMSLDQQRELAYWRKRGLLTPSAPPAGEDEE